MTTLLVIGEVSTRQYRNMRFRILFNYNNFPTIRRCNLTDWHRAIFECNQTLHFNARGAFEAFLNRSPSLGVDFPVLSKSVSNIWQYILGVPLPEVAGVIINPRSGRTQTWQPPANSHISSLDVEGEEERDLLSNEGFINLCEHLFNQRIFYRAIH
jgi:hypothetical protein